MKKKAIIIVGILILLGTIIFTSYSYVGVKHWDSLILPTVKIENEDLTGKTKKEAQKIMMDKYSSQVIKKKIDIVTKEKKYTLDYSMLDAKYNINEAIEEAYSYGRGMNMFQKYKAIKNPVLKQIKLTFNYNDKIVDQMLTEIAKNTNKKAVNSTITMVSSGVFNVTNDASGRQLQADILKKDIKSKINGVLSADVISIVAPVTEVKPKISEAALKSINTRISTYTTNYESSAEGRATNIGLSTESINGTLLMPGDVFSFNGTVGERTAGRGYQSAGVIIGDKIEQGLGGGICQVSSTLYNAILGTELVSVERTHHTISSGYIPKGQDATVDYGNLDYKFKNTYKYPIYIEGVVSNRNIYFNVYSNSTLTNRTYEIVSEILEVTQPKTETIQDATKYEGESEIVKTGYNGFKVKVSRKTYENGKLVDTQVINKDTFNVINGVIKVGTKKK
ncbi:VanW family protein [Clostridium tagluense]|uniref:VanW family protein n=1 Tax=Clostridium tagluense TaxID=360422 RepID=UPI001C0AF130|nr:VanW family protein [Clostridium tagluense]MBU3127025.1 VanW family protein [Clostridium tagluense]MCB2311027.1 VanW family protein [Clostridium tagluense]MCB2316885.1 VanW family protein [Clostridium tagluense]MCB2321733.1 VanW family protein [Clostridium tagluense]MCB2325647.1 VanW family protein [Clostridium tagluense]